MPVSKTPRATKPCVECKKEFVPTGNCQKRCEECRKIKSHHPAVRVKTRKPKDALPPIDPRMIDALKESMPKHEFMLGNYKGMVKGIREAAQKSVREDPSTWQAAAKAKALAFAIKHGHGVKPVESNFAAFIQGLHAAGVTGLAFGNVKITIEAI